VFTVGDATELYEVDRWGKGYFSISSEGHVLVHPTKDPQRAIDLKQLTDQRLSAMRSVDLEYSVIVRLMILFGSRYGEMAKLAWSEIDLDKGILHIPTLYPDGSRRLKSNRGASRDLTIYMPQAAIDLIKKIPRRPGRDFLFGIGPRGLTENDLQKKALDAIILKNEGAPITYVHRSNGGDAHRVERKGDEKVVWDAFGKTAS